MKSPRSGQNFYYITTLDSQTNNCPEHAFLLEDKIFSWPFFIFSVNTSYPSECDENIKHWLNIYFVLSLRWDNWITDQSLVRSDSRQMEMGSYPTLDWHNTQFTLAEGKCIFCFHLSNLGADRNLPGRLEWERVHCKGNGKILFKDSLYMKYFIKDHKKLCVPPPQSIYLIFGQKELFLSDIGYFAQQRQQASRK